MLRYFATSIKKQTVLCWEIRALTTYCGQNNAQANITVVGLHEYLANVVCMVTVKAGVTLSYLLHECRAIKEYCFNIAS